MNGSHGPAEALSALDGAAARGVPWWEAARALLLLEASGEVHASGRPWGKVAADVSGYAYGNLRRMAKVAGFVADVAPRVGADPATLAALPMSHLDAVMRIDAYDRDEAVRILRGLAHGGPSDVTFRSLLAVSGRLRATSRAPSPAIAGASFSRGFRKRCMALLDAGGLLGDAGGHRIVTADHHYANPDHVLLREGADGVGFVEGIDCVSLFGKAERGSVRRHALGVVTEAGFFDRFWAVLPEDNAGEFHAECLALGMPNVTLVVVDTAVGRIIARMGDASAPPSPDRRALWRNSNVIPGPGGKAAVSPSRGAAKR